MPRMLRGIVGAIVRGQPDLRVVGEVDTSEALVACARRTRPDVLIVGPDPSVLTTSRHLMAVDRRLRVIEVVGDISPEALLAVVRGS